MTAVPATFLAYVNAVPGRLYPLVLGLMELRRRGHRVAVRCGERDVEALRSEDIPAEALAPEIARFDPGDWRARTRFGALRSGLAQFADRAPFQIPDLQRAIEAERPDVLLIDEGAWGAAAAAERSGLPWAYSVVSAMPLPSRDAPPFGLGLAPRHDALGRLRDRLARRLALGSLERMIAARVNPLRASLGLAPVRTLDDLFLAASRVIAFTAEPFEYPRTDWPESVRLVGPGLWEPPAAEVPWLEDIDGPLVLVTCSTLFQNDRRIVEVACAALRDEPYDVVITTGDVNVTGITVPTNVRLAPFVPHSPLLDRAACVVCHAGMGITQKALAHGVPVVAIPFGRDQPEVARRVEVAGAGVRLPARALRPDRLREAVVAAMRCRPGAERLAAAFAASGGPGAMADELEGLVAPAAARPTAAD